jgi:aerotaxis receptor
MQYFRRVFEEKKEKSSPCESKKDYFQSIIYGKNKIKLIDEEYKFDDGLIVSSTDLKGIITYANRKFCELSGYSKNELVGSNHNIIRHPHMPRALFKELWSSLHCGNEWTGIVKNLRKDGRYYWVYSHIVPIVEDEKIVGYSATRRPVLAVS